MPASRPPCGFGCAQEKPSSMLCNAEQITSSCTHVQAGKPQYLIARLMGAASVRDAALRVTCRESPTMGALRPCAQCSLTWCLRPANSICWLSAWSRHWVAMPGHQRGDSPERWQLKCQSHVLMLLAGWPVMSQMRDGWPRLEMASRCTLH